jgi:hypothetical protein
MLFWVREPLANLRKAMSAASLGWCAVIVQDVRCADDEQTLWTSMEFDFAAVLHLVGSFSHDATALTLRATESTGRMLFSAHTILAISCVPIKALLHKGNGNTSGHCLDGRGLTRIVQSYIVDEFNSSVFVRNEVGLGDPHRHSGCHSRASGHIFVGRGKEQIFPCIDDLEIFDGMSVCRVGPLDVGHTNAWPDSDNASLIFPTCRQPDRLPDFELLASTLPVSSVCFEFAHWMRE